MQDYKTYYQYQIYFLQLQANQLFPQITMLKTEINKRKQQNQHPIKQNFDLLNEMEQRLLATNAEIQTCQHFYAINHSFINMNYFNEINSIYLNKLQQNFNKQQHQERRQEQLQLQPQNLHNNYFENKI